MRYVQLVILKIHASLVPTKMIYRRTMNILITIKTQLSIYLIIVHATHWRSVPRKHDLV